MGWIPDDPSQHPLKKELYMTREDRLSIIYDAFDACAERFCVSTGGSFHEIISIYKGRADSQELKYRSAFIYYKSFLVQLKYTAHCALGVTNSVLECLVHRSKENDSIAIPLPLLLSYIGENSTLPLYIPSINSASAMREAFSCIEEAFSNAFDAISKVFSALPALNELLSRYFADMSLVLNTDINWENFSFYVDDDLYSFLTIRFTSPAFINYIKGDTKTAAKQLSKIKRRTAYEEWLLQELKCDDISVPTRLPLIKDALSTYSKSGAQNAGSGKEFLALFLSWFIITIAVSPAYIGLSLLFTFLEGRDSVYLIESDEKIFFCFVAAFITSIAISYFTRLKFYKLLFVRDFENYQATDEIQNGVGSDKIMRGFLTILIIASVVLIVLFAKWNVKFLDYGIVDNSRFFSLEGEYSDYGDIDFVYCKEERVNDFNEVLNAPSYVIVFKDGREIDLYEIAYVEEYEQDLLDLMQEKGVEIRRRNAAK